MMNPEAEDNEEAGAAAEQPGRAQENTQLQGRLSEATAALERKTPGRSGDSELNDLLTRLIEIAEANAALADRQDVLLDRAASDIARLEAWAREHRSA